MKINQPHDRFIKSVLNKKEKLTPVIGYVYYHGKENWNTGTSFNELEEYNDSLKEYIIDFKYVLNNLRKIPDEELRGTERKLYYAPMDWAFRTK